MTATVNQLTTPGLYFLIRDTVTTKEKMTVVELIESICVKHSVSTFKERRRIYHRVVKAAHLLHSQNIIRVERFDPEGKGNKKLLLCSV